MLKKIITKAARIIKNDEGYSLDNSLSLYMVLQVLMFRSITLIRGTIFQLLHFRKPILLFLGPHTVIRYQKMLGLSGTTTIGSSVTLECLGNEGIYLGNNVTIPDHCYIRCSGVITDIGVGVKIGNNTGLGHYNFINGQGGVTIEEDVIIGPYVTILSENHKFGRIDIPIRKQGVSRRGVVIESNVWIGSNVTILDGVKIGKGSVIGAGSIVTKSIPNYSIAVGIPCKVIKRRE